MVKYIYLITLSNIRSEGCIVVFKHTFAGSNLKKKQNLGKFVTLSERCMKFPILSRKDTVIAFFLRTLKNTVFILGIKIKSMTKVNKNC